MYQLDQRHLDQGVILIVLLSVFLLEVFFIGGILTELCLYICDCDEFNFQFSPNFFNHLTPPCKKHETETGPFQLTQNWLNCILEILHTPPFQSPH